MIDDERRGSGEAGVCVERDAGADDGSGGGDGGGVGSAGGEAHDHGDGGVGLDEPVVIWSYYCRDGYVRSRCAEHIDADGPYAPVNRRAFFDQRPGRRRSCVRCFYGLR